MWNFVFVALFGVASVEGQNGRDTQHEHGHGWDIRLSVPGEPGSDYPTLGSIPRTSFSCAGKEPGYYADLETDCQVFRVCTVGSTYGFQSFLCPNGTLFNQAVFVCDWWMNVHCEKSAQLFETTGERFGNLKLGPQLMKDIKKMLTYPMRTPYDKSEMKSNLIVIQDYKPPFGQLFPNGALLATPERTPNNVYIPAKQIQGNAQNVYNDNNIAFAASTPNPRYLPPTFNTIQSDSQGNTETFQRQRQNGQYLQRDKLIQNSQTQQLGNTISNGHAGRITQSSNTVFSNNIENSPEQVMRPIQHSQFGQRQRNNFISTSNMQNGIKIQRGQLNEQNSQYTNDKKLSQLNSGKLSNIGVSLSRQQSTFKSNQEKQPYIYNTPSARLINDISQIEAKQNLVSTTNRITPTIIAKTLTLSRLVEDPKPGKPKSRITVKTWIVKPSKTAKLISPTPYTYNRPTPTERLTDSTPYVYNTPTALPQPARIVSETNQPYVYNRPTVSANQVVTTAQTATQSYLSPITARPTLASKLYLLPSPPPTRASRLYLVPTTFKPAARIYLPPEEDESDAPVVPARQYLASNLVQRPTYKPSEQLRVSPTTPTPTYTVPITTLSTSTIPSFSFTKQSQINTNHNNLTFSDILTKEKLDITVNNIVEHTSNFLNTASPAQFGQIRQDISSLDYSEDSDFYLPPGATTDSGEVLTSQTPPVASKSSRLIAPSMNLEPPEETYNNNKITNQLSNLPFFKEPALPTNTIERTVSLKISIPEKIASYLFNRRNETDFDRLEILNTGSSNYLVLTNNPFNNNNKSNFIPIGRLIEDKSSNISNSQALVFSLLADSINVAKEYSNLAKQEISSSTQLQSPIQNANDEEITQITNRISQLTSSQYGNNINNINSEKIVSTAQTTSITPIQYTETIDKKVVENNIQNTQPLSTAAPPQQTNQIRFSERFQTSDTNDLKSSLLNSNQNQIYSGQYYQYPVPDVTSQIYNRQSSGNLIQTNNVRSQNTSPNLNNNVNNLAKPTSAQVEIVRSQTLPLPPARLQLPPTLPNELESFNNQESINELLRSGNGISAQVEDKIIGTIRHPLENNKLVSYQNDQSYYVYTKLDDTIKQLQNNGGLQPNRASGQQNAKLTQNSNIPNIVALQFLPPVNYQLEDEKEQQRILNAFQIDEFGAPRQQLGQIQNNNQRDEILTSDINYTVDHSQSKQATGQYNDINTLYTGPSSYSAPQSSVGNLKKQINNFNSRLELDENSGYSRVVPARQFTF